MGGYFGNERREMLPFVPSDARRVLELGCGEGRFGALLKARQSVEVWGVETHPEAARAAGSRLDRVVSGDVNGIWAQLPEGRFDVVVLNDVLEHLADPDACLRQVAARLEPRGLVVSSIPNVRYFRVLWDLLFKAKWEYADHGVLDRTHLRFFTSDSIRQLYAQNGFEVVRHEGLNPSRSLKPWLLKLLGVKCAGETRYLQFGTVARLTSPARRE